MQKLLCTNTGRKEKFVSEGNPFLVFYQFAHGWPRKELSFSGHTGPGEVRSEVRE